MTEPYYFQEAVQEPTLVDLMVEEYDSIVKNSSWEMVLRLVDKSVVRSIWIYKVKKVSDGSVDKYKAIFVEIGRAHV